jgi:3-deoxy-manno-octulosonate cytidylyltransferase (CMP-KDO synthetase)
MAMYFSRAPMPWARDAFMQGISSLPVKDLYLRHLGIYAYRVSFLNAYVQWPPALLEQVEALEQLRALYYGVKIHVDLACGEFTRRGGHARRFRTCTPTFCARIE